MYKICENDNSKHFCPYIVIQSYIPTNKYSGCYDSMIGYIWNLDFYDTFSWLFQILRIGFTSNVF